ncbi:MAG: DoxX family protein [Calditrichaeota bacterium]|nr:MAG: DoxX family protein [Calditrichota bacterium]MBL1203851.1 DoxX family protein [Calditrichota bacterium]NOG43683.1 DoxX family protein [Calditrichota bacterium]
MLELYNKFRDSLSLLEDVAPLLFRFLLAYVFYVTGMMKFNNFEGIVYWFEHGLNLPFPTLNAFMATATEVAGFVLLFLGLGTRLISIPLFFVMIVAMVTVHMDNGWLVIGSSDLNPEIASRLSAAKDILKEYGNYDWLTEKGSFVILQNGIENVVTYMAMLLSLIVKGPGKISLDALLEAKLNK